MKKILFVGFMMFNVSFAQLAFDRTRVIFDHSKTNSVSVIVENGSPNMPYLAQTWIEDGNGNKIEEPLVSLPMLQRLNPKQEKQIKISLVGNTDSLPKDRESLLQFSVLGLPPTDTDGQSKLNILVRSNLKLFYRPKGLPQYAENAIFEELKVQQQGNSLLLDNPTPYHIVIYAFSAKKGVKLIDKDIIMKPFSQEKVAVSVGSTPHIYFINDNGVARSLSYQCSSSACSVMK